MADETKKRVSPGEFMRQVRSEMRRVTWPTRKETMLTTFMVLLMSVVMAVFFLLIDQYFSAVTKTAMRQDAWTTGDQILMVTFAVAVGGAIYFIFLRREGR